MLSTVYLLYKITRCHYLIAQFSIYSHSAEGPRPWVSIQCLEVKDITECTIREIPLHRHFAHHLSVNCTVLVSKNDAFSLGNNRNILKFLTLCSSLFWTSKLGWSAAFSSLRNWTLFTRLMHLNIRGWNDFRKYVPCPEEQKRYFISTRTNSLDVRTVSPTKESKPVEEIWISF